MKSGWERGSMIICLSKSGIEKEKGVLIRLIKLLKRKVQWL